MDRNNTISRWVYRLYLCELLLIWSLGTIAAWQDQDMLMRATSVVGALGWLIALRTLMAPDGSAWQPWRGVAIFAASWLTFPLFKAICHGWIETVYDAPLLAIDRVVFAGRSLPEHAFALENVPLSEILSGGYFAFYFVVLLPVIWAAWRRKRTDAQTFLLGLNLTYMLGFVGYLLVPAGGPYQAFPETFPYPPAGGPMTAFLVGMVEQGITGMDVFPSLHSGVSLYVFGFFFLNGYRRAALLLAPIVLAIIVATVYLRYHYGVDLFAGIVLSLAVLWLVASISHRKDAS